MLLNFFIPDAQQISQHPIYKLEIRRMPKRDLTRLVRYSLGWFVRALIVFGLLWVVIISNKQNDDPFEISTEIIAWVAGVSFLIGFLLDFVTILVSVGGFSQGVHWDLMRLTLLDEQGVIRVRHTLAQLQSWRFTMIVVSWRIAAVVLLWLQVFLIKDYNKTIFQAFLENPLPFFEMVSVLYVLFLFLIVFMIEPLLRMRLMTALATAVSARIHHLTFAIMAGLGALLFVWISVPVFLGIVLAAFVKLGSILDNYASDFEFIFAIDLFITLGTASLYLYYRLLRGWALRRALRDAFRIN